MSEGTEEVEKVAAYIEFGVLLLGADCVKQRAQKNMRSVTLQGWNHHFIIARVCQIARNAAMRVPGPNAAVHR